MVSTEYASLLERAEHLLWVIARYDVENLGQRQYVLDQLREVEERIHRLGAESANTYWMVVHHSSLRD